MKFKIYLLIAFLAASNLLFSQSAKFSKATLSTEIAGVKTEAHSSQVLLFLDYSNQDFLMFIPLSSIKTYIPMCDSALSLEFDNKIVFKTTFSESLFDMLRNANDSRMFTSKGDLIINKERYEVVLSYKPVNFGSKDDLKNLLIDIHIELNPVDIKIPVLSNCYPNPISLDILGGYLNDYLLARSYSY